MRHPNANNTMDLLPLEVEQSLPALYSQDGKGDEATVHVKFFHPMSDWTWYATEYDPENQMFFGLVDGFEAELGYFSLHELKETLTGPGVAMERDKFWEPKTLGEVRKEIGR